MHQIFLKLQFLGFAPRMVAAEIHVPLSRDVLLIVSEHGEHFAVRAASDGQVPRICLDATEVLVEIRTGKDKIRELCAGPQRTEPLRITSHRDSVLAKAEMKDSAGSLR